MGNSSFNSRQNRVYWIDISRGIAILLVIFGHLPLLPQVNTLVYSFHMPLFFIISGFFAFDRISIPFISFLKKKQKRLILPYILYGLFIMLPFGILLLAIRNNNYDICYLMGAYSKNVIGHIIGLRGDWPYSGTYWFLPCLFTAYILIFLISKYFKPYTLLIVIGIATLGFLYSMSIHKSLPLSIDLACVAVLFMYIGYLSYKNLQNINWVAVVLFLLLGIIAAYRNGKIEMYDGSYNNPLLFILSGFGISIFVLKLATTIKNIKLKSCLEWLGINSIIIYMLHYLLRPVISSLIVRLPHNTNLSFNIIYNIGGVMLICLALYPAVNFINRKMKFTLGF